METAKTILEAAAAYGFSPLNLVLMVMLYFMGAHAGVWPKFWKKGDDENKTPTVHDLYAEISKLKMYFNHETTERLDKIVERQKGIGEDVKSIVRKHDEYEKYGIKTRRATT